MGSGRKRRFFDTGLSDAGGRFGVGEIVSQMKMPRLGNPTGSVASPGDASPSPAESNSGIQSGWCTPESKLSRKMKTKTKKKAGQHDSDRDPPQLSFDSEIVSPLRVKDLQDLVLYVLSDGIAPTWLAVRNVRQIRKVVVLMIPGLDREMLETATVRIRHSAAGHNKDDTVETAEGKRDRGANHLEHHNAGTDTHSTLQDFRGSTDKEDPPAPFAGPDDLDLAPPSDRNQLFDHVIPVNAPGDWRHARVFSPLQAMLISPLPDSKDKKNAKVLAEAVFQAIQTPISTFIHTADELREAEYPVHPAAFADGMDGELENERRQKAGQSASTGWVDTIVSSTTPHVPDMLHTTLDPITLGLSIYAIDCEMVLTSDDAHSLARISVVDWHGKVVLDKYVKPSIPIKDYFTQYSGITVQILENVTTTLADIQKELMALFTPATVLLGHSLESDLNALKMTHPFIIDTSMIYPHPRGLPLRSSLKFLANKYLKREIQVAGARGHDSVEDARAVLDLVRLKCEKGPSWGTTEQNGETIFRRLSRSSRTSATVEYGTPERGLGREATYAIGCQSDDDVARGLIRAINGDEDEQEIPTGGVDFVWGRFRELEAVRGWNSRDSHPPRKTSDSKPENATYGQSTISNTTAPIAGPPAAVTKPPVASTENSQSSLTSTSSPSPASPSPSNRTLATQANRTLSHLSTIYASLPPATLLIVLSGTGDMRHVLELQALQSQYRKEFKVKKWDELSVKWTDDEDQALRRAVDEARKGVGIVAIK